jgi:hypothetical protein
LSSQKPIEHLNSLGLRYHDELAGWMITHREEAQVIRYSGLYVHPEIRGLGPALYLLKEAIHRHVEREPETLGLMEINQRFAPRNWLHFVEKRLKPFAVKIENVMTSHLILTDPFIRH